MDRHELLVDSLLTWISENINFSPSINDVALRSGYSKWHIQRIFQQVTQQNLGEYIRNLKLERAAIDLIETDESIIEISFKYSFASQQAFTRCFSRKYQVPPAAFRRTHKF